MKKEIERGIDEAKRLRYPNVPSFAIPKTKLKDGSSNELTKSIISYLTLKGAWATRINTVGIFDQKIKKMRKSTTKKGTADIHGCFRGRHLSVEVKFGKDSLSDEQKEVRSQILAAGGWYCVAKTLDQFIKDFENEFK